MAAQLKTDISVLLLPSAARALTLDKAYGSIVLEQGFAKGRDATVEPAQNAHRRFIDDEQETGVTAEVLPRRAAPRYLADNQPPVSAGSVRS